jgi:hypothetical protein
VKGLFRAFALLVAAGLGGCPARQVPAGLPPPEYERPEVPPWPPADAASDAPAALPTDAGPAGASPSDGAAAPEAGAADAGVG